MKRGVPCLCASEPSRGLLAPWPGLWMEAAPAGARRWARFWSMSATHCCLCFVDACWGGACMATPTCVGYFEGDALLFLRALGGDSSYSGCGHKADDVSPAVCTSKLPIPPAPFPRRRTLTDSASCVNVWLLTPIADVFCGEFVLNFPRTRGSGASSTLHPEARIEEFQRC